MPLRTILNPKTEVYETTAQKSIRFKRDDAQTKRVIDTLVRQNSGDLNIAGGVAEDLPFGDVDVVTLLHIQFEFAANATVKTASILLNGGTEPMVHGPQSGQNFSEFIWEAPAATPITQVNITNGDATEVLKGVFLVAGDAA